MRTKPALLGVCGFFLIALVIGAYVLYAKQQAVPYSASRPVSKVLSRQNSDFAAAENYRHQGDYALATQDYQKALATATDPLQKGQIEYDIALTAEQSGDHIGAIRLYKALAADMTKSPAIRAYAVQEIGLMYYNYLPDRNAIIAETFKDPPYSAFAQTADTALAYRRLFQFAAAFFPLGPSEARIAYWYASDVATNLKATTTTEAVSEIGIVDQSIAKADAYIQANAPDPYTSAFVSSAYAREGLALGELASVGAADPSSAEGQFQNAVQLADAAGIYGYGRYDYANFLAAFYGAKRASDIQNLLAVFSTANNQKISPSLMSLFTLARTDPTLAQDRENLVLLGKIDPPFKTYLISLGWKGTDFR